MKVDGHNMNIKPDAHSDSSDLPFMRVISHTRKYGGYRL